MPGLITVYGAGSWGTALTWMLASAGRSVTLCCRDPQIADEIRSTRRNSRYHPDLELPETVAATSDASAAARDMTLAILAVPTEGLRGAVERIRADVPAGCSILIASKGVETATGDRVSEIVLEAGSPTWQPHLGVLSGPNLSGELVRGVPTTSVVATWNREVGRQIQETLSTSFFRVYTNSDVVGVELGGALKNPIAIAAGISDGLGFGENSKAALVTRGLAEITRLGRACGGQPSTFAGLAGIGDLVATCHSPISRNYRLGVSLGRGMSLQEALAELGQVAEGVPTSQGVAHLAERMGVEMPITAELRQVLFQGKPPLEAVTALMSREFRAESADWE